MESTIYTCDLIDSVRNSLINNKLTIIEIGIKNNLTFHQVRYIKRNLI